VDEQLVPEINADVNHPFRPAAPGAVPEEQQVALLELAQVPRDTRCEAFEVRPDTRPCSNHCEFQNDPSYGLASATF
jgi:hypothetical protein